jgi:hypothetical protein
MTKQLPVQVMTNDFELEVGENDVPVNTPLLWEYDVDCLYKQCHHFGVRDGV